LNCAEDELPLGVFADRKEVIKELAERLQALSTQSLVTTHSSLLAGSYKPDQALFARKDRDDFIVSVLRTEAIASITKNVVRRLYTKNRIEVPVAGFGDSKLRVTVTGLAASRPQAEVAAYVARWCCIDRLSRQRLSGQLTFPFLC
jgi:hypothetical protein